MTSDSRLIRLLSLPWFWFAVALLIRLLYLLDEAGRSPLFFMPLLDEKEAVDSALEVLWGMSASEPYFKAPGYSWIMAAIMAVSGDAWPWTVRAVQHVAGAGLVVMAVQMARRVSPAGRVRAWAAAITGFLATTYAPLIRLETNLSLDFWVVFFQSAMLWMLGRAVMARNGRRRGGLFFVAGIAAAAAWLTRPTLTAILPFLVAWIFVAVGSFPTGHRSGNIPAKLRSYRSHNKAWSCKALLPVLLFLLPIIVAATGTAVRNQVVAKQPLVLPWQGGFSFYHANRPGATGRYYLQDSVAETTDANPTRFLSVEGFRQSLAPDQRKRFDASPRYGDVNQFWMARGLADIKADPQGWLALMIRKGVYLFNDKEIYNYEDFDLQRERSPLLTALPSTFGPCFSAALLSLLALGLLSPVRRRLVGLQWLYIITLGGAIALYFVSGRMRMPLAFPVLVLAGPGVAMALLRFSRLRQSVAVALFMAGLVFTFGDWWGVRSESMAYADLARMSNAAWYRGHYDKALDFALEAEAQNPGYPALPRLKAQALYGLGRLEESATEFQKSVHLLGDETSRRNLGIIQQELNQNAAKASDATAQP